MLRRSRRVLIFLLKASRVSPKQIGVYLVTPKIVYRKMEKNCQPPRHLSEILLLIVFVAHVDLFE